MNKRIHYKLATGVDDRSLLDCMGQKVLTVDDRVVYESFVSDSVYQQEKQGVMGLRLLECLVEPVLPLGMDWLRVKHL